MAPQKTKYKKIPKPVYIEPELIEFAVEESLLYDDCFHPINGSYSEHVRRGYKSWLLTQYPNIKLNKNLKHVDWAEAY